MKKIKNQDKRFYYKGAIHIHSLFSDGSGNIDQISKAAHKAGLDWIIITDHNNMDIEEGIFNNVYVIKGEEISSTSNHYLALGIDKPILPTLSPEECVNNVRNEGGFGFVAHPDESDNRKNIHKPIKWTDKNVMPDGIEIWNWFSNWADNYCDKNIFTLVYAYLFKHTLITCPYKTTLEWWDKLNIQNKENIVPAIGGSDAHALKIKKYLFPVTIFSYETIFNSITNIINLNEKLSDDFNCAKIQILDAICTGRNLIINRKISKQIPQINIYNKNTSATCGEIISIDSNTELYIKLCKTFNINILLNGTLLYNIIGNEILLPISQKGKYRIEIMHNSKGFAFTNPVFVV